MISRRPERPQLKQTEHLKLYSIYLQLDKCITCFRLLLAMESGLVYEKSIFGAAGLLANVTLISFSLKVFGFDVVNKALFASGLVSTHRTSEGARSVLDDTGLCLQSDCLHLT